MGLNWVDLLLRIFSGVNYCSTEESPGIESADVKEPWIWRATSSLPARTVSSPKPHVDQGSTVPTDIYPYMCECV